MTRQERFLRNIAVVANVVLILGAIASTLIFLYFFYHYTWTAERQFTRPTGRLVYYGGPLAAAIVLLAAALWLKRDRKINLAIMCVTLVLSVYAGELALRFMASEISQPAMPIMTILEQSEAREKIAAELAKKYGREIDTRDRLQVLKELRAKGIEAVPSVIPKHQLRYYKKNDAKKDDAGAATRATATGLIALGGISNKLTIWCNETGQRMTYESDEHGFRNPKGLWHSRPIDIVALGDSFTQGQCVAPGKSFVDIIREQYPATLNLAMAGEGPLLMLATLKEYARPLRPRVVLWFYFEGNDLVDLEEERTSAVLMRYLEEGSFSQHLTDRQPEIDQVLADFVEEEKAREIAHREARKRNRAGVVGELISFAKLPALRTKLELVHATTAEETELAAKVNEVKTDFFRRVLSDAKATVTAWGGTVYFVYLPNWTRFEPKLVAFDQRLVANARDDILNTIRDLEIPIIDLLPAFERERDPMSLFPFRAPGHYAESGHRVVGEQVVNALATEGVAGRRAAGRTTGWETEK